MPLQQVLASAPHTLVEVAVVGSNPALPLAGHTEDWNAAAVVVVEVVAVANHPPPLARDTAYLSAAAVVVVAKGFCPLWVALVGQNGATLVLEHWC